MAARRPAGRHFKEKTAPLARRGRARPAPNAFGRRTGNTRLNPSAMRKEQMIDSYLIMSY